MPVGVVENQHLGTLLAEQSERDATFRAAMSNRLQVIEGKLSRILEMLGHQKPNPLTA
jgi:hypothetical protein